MSIACSLCEAKARFSEVIRQLHEGRTVTVTYRGEPVAEIRSIIGRCEPSLDRRLKDLEQSGALVRPALPKRTFRPIKRRRGAFSRFLTERGE